MVIYMVVELKKNKRAFDSQVKIYKALRQVLLRKPLIDVTVTDIEKECGISRSTFYRNYKNMVEVLEAMVDYFYNRYLENRVGKENQLLFFFEYWNNHKDLIYIVSHQNINVLKNVMKKHEEEKNMDPFVLDFQCSIMTSLLTVWVESKEKLTPQDMELKTLDIIKKFNKSKFL